MFIVSNVYFIKIKNIQKKKKIHYYNKNKKK